MYKISIKPRLNKTFQKLAKKNPKLLRIIYKKVEMIVVNPHRYKNLRAPLDNWKRVHIDRNFVLAFSVDEKSKTVILEEFDHHDYIYKK